MKKMPDKSEVKKILFVTLSNLGDIILTTPVLEKLRDSFPEAVIDVITGPPGESVFSSHPAVRNVMVRDRRQRMTERIAELTVLRREKYDLVADMKNSFLPGFAGVRFRSARVKDYAGHKREEHLSKLAGLVEAPFEGCRFFIPISGDDKTYVADMIGGVEGQMAVVVNPGAKSHLKRWPAVCYAELADRLISGHGCRVFITGAEEDSVTVDVMVSAMKEEGTNLCGKTTIGELAELMQRSALVITNDSAPLHIASAVNAPVLAVFGPSNEKKYGPLSRSNRVISPDVDCRPCSKALCSPGPDEGCITAVTVDSVLRAAEELMG